MSVAPIRKPRTDETVELLREIRDLLRAMRAEWRRHPRHPLPAAEDPAGVARLIEALGDYFGPSPFTTAGVLRLAEEDPQGAIASALAELLDMTARPHARAVALGTWFVRRAERVVAGARGGVRVYRLETPEIPEAPR